MNNYNENSRMTIEEVLALAAKGGVTFETSDFAEAQKRNEAYSTQLQADTEIAPRSKIAQFVEWFNNFYPRFLKTLLGIGEVLVTAAHTVLIAFGVPLMLIALMIVEQTRVYYGALLIDARPELAAGIAWVLVAANLMAEMIIHWEENRKGWQTPPRFDFSLRLWAQWVGYVIGLPGWKPTEKSPAFWARIVLRLITITILMLAISGSMQNAMDTTQGKNWLSAIWLILTQSSLAQMITWVGGLMLAITLVTAAQGFSQYIAKKVIEIAAIMQSSTNDKMRSAAEVAGLAGAMYLYGRYKELQRQQRKNQALVSALDYDKMDVYSGVVRVPDVSGTIETPETKLPPAVQKAVEWLDKNPQCFKHEGGDYTVRSAAEIAGLSAATLNRGMKIRNRSMN